MPFYFYRGEYTTAAWSKLIAQPQDVSEAMKPSILRFGGKAVACFLAFAGGGEPFGFIEFPDNAAATAWGLYLQSQGVLKEAALTPVLSAEETVEALRRLAQGSPTDAHGW